MIEKWQKFLQEHSVLIADHYGRTPAIMTEFELSDFERKTGIELPPDYRSFLQLLGVGLFTQTVGGFHLSIEPLNIEDSINAFYSLKISLEYERERGEISDPEHIEGLLNHGFIFAGNGKGGIFVWDLRSYRESDKNYDIYLCSIHDSPLVFYPVGRDFLEFICDFGLGLNPNKHKSLPKRLRPKLMTPYCMFRRATKTQLMES